MSTVTDLAVEAIRRAMDDAAGPALVGLIESGEVVAWQDMGDPDTIRLDLDGSLAGVVYLPTAGDAYGDVELSGALEERLFA